MRKFALLLIVVFVLVSVASVWAGKLKVKTLEGKVSFICPKHCAIKVKAGEKETLLLVYDKCPKKDELIEQIEGLEVGDEVTVSYWQCPKSKKLYLTKIEQPEDE